MNDRVVCYCKLATLHVDGGRLTETYTVGEPFCLMSYTDALDSIHDMFSVH